jgi:hypothetical protein
MIAVRRPPGAGAARLCAAFITALILAVPAVPAAAQEPVPRDTIPRDTLVVDPELLPEAEASDTAPPPARPVVPFPSMRTAPTAGFAAGVWHWDREALLRETPTSLVDLLERIPGVTTFRAGLFGQPEAAAAFGGTAARVEIELDGYVIDPLGTASLDLAHMPLAHIRELHVQRRLGLLRIRVTTEEPADTIPYTRVEAGIGQPAANLFRGLLLAPHVIIGPLGFALEKLDTDGANGRERSDLFSGWGKWGWTDGRRGVQLELVRSTLERSGDSPWPIDRVRQDVLVRARNTFSPSIMAEIYAGRSTQTDSILQAPEDTTLDRHVRHESTQIGGRLTLRQPLGMLQARVRYRDAAELPRLEAALEADANLGPVRLSGEAVHARWPGRETITGSGPNPLTYYAWLAPRATTYFGAHAEVAVLAGTSAFAEITGGMRGAPPYPGSSGPVFTDRTGWRAGVSASLFGGRATGSVAGFSMTQDAAWPFGLPFDSLAAPAETGDGRGIEAMGRLVLVPDWLALESWISEWVDVQGWSYVPARSWRTALEVHTLPLPSGNLEILGRLEAAQRGSFFSFLPGPATPETPDVTVVPAHTRLDGYLQIRIIDVRIFLRWEDFLSQRIEHLPGRFRAGPRIFYGVKWNLWN